MEGIKVQSCKDIWFSQCAQQSPDHGLNSPTSHPFFVLVQCQRPWDNLKTKPEIHLCLVELPSLRGRRLPTLARQPCQCTSS
jgi:hypothetical protein